MMKTSTTENGNAIGRWFIARLAARVGRLWLVGLLLIAAPTYAANCIAIQSGDSMRYAKTNPPACMNAKGEAHGLFEYRHSDGTTSTGFRKNGLSNGPWVFTYSFGATEQAMYVDGKRHGIWVLEMPSKGICRKSRYKDNVLISAQNCD